MEQPSILRETRMGQKGFVKEDVLTYLDELNSKNEELEKKLKEVSGERPADPQEIIKFRTQVDNLQAKLNSSNMALREAIKEKEELQKQLDRVRAGGSASAAGSNVVENPQTKAALDAARREIDNLRSQLKTANAKAAASAPAQGGASNQQTAAAIEAAKKEIDNLRGQLKAADQKASDAARKTAEAEKRAADAEKKAAEAAKNVPSVSAASNADLEKAKQELTKITADLKAQEAALKAKTAELEAANKAVAEKDSQIAQLKKDGEAAADKDKEIAELNKEIATLKENVNNPAALMGSLFTEAQKTVNQLKAQAEQEAAATTKDADEKAKKVVDEANAVADKTIKDANSIAEKTIKDANQAAEKTINDANAQAEAAVNDANSKVAKLNEMSSTVRSMLLTEIESVNARFNDLTASMNTLASQASDRIKDAQVVIDQARDAVGSKEDNAIKTAEASKAKFEAASAPRAASPVAESAPSSKNVETAPKTSSNDPFASVSGGAYRGGSSASAKPQNPGFGGSAHSRTPASEAPKPAPKKPVSNFNFDMSDLLKAAEEEAAKEQ